MDEFFLLQNEKKKPIPNMQSCAKGNINFPPRTIQKYKNDPDNSTCRTQPPKNKNVETQTNLIIMPYLEGKIKSPSIRIRTLTDELRDMSLQVRPPQMKNVGIQSEDLTSKITIL